MAKSGGPLSWLGAVFGLSVAMTLMALLILARDPIVKSAHPDLYSFLFLAGIGGTVWLFLAAKKSSDKIRVRKRAAADRAAQCKHGIRGAVCEPTLCRECVHEREEQQKHAKLAAEQEAARRERERQERHQEYVRRIRLPEHLRSMRPGEFERVVCDLFRRLGYEAEPTPISGDSGVDGYLRKNGALSVLQCKRVKGSVGEPILRDLFGTMHSHGAKEGIVVTTGKVSVKARRWATGKPIRIIELDELVQLVREHYKEDEVVPEDFQPNAPPPDLCPRCGKPLRPVKWRGGEFLGCSGYPTCRYKGLIGRVDRPRYWKSLTGGERR